MIMLMGGFDHHPARGNWREILFELGRFGLYVLVERFGMRHVAYGDLNGDLHMTFLSRFDCKINAMRGGDSSVDPHQLPIAAV
jgi:hypothetical protein